MAAKCWPRSGKTQSNLGHVYELCQTDTQKSLNGCENVEFEATKKCVNLVDLLKKY